MYTISVFIDIKNLLTVSYLWAVFTHYVVVTDCSCSAGHRAVWGCKCRFTWIWIFDQSG